MCEHQGNVTVVCPCLHIIYWLLCCLEVIMSDKLWFELIMFCQSKTTNEVKRLVIL